MASGIVPCAQHVETGSAREKSARVGVGDMERGRSAECSIWCMVRMGLGRRKSGEMMQYALSATPLQVIECGRQVFLGERCKVRSGIYLPIAAHIHTTGTHAVLWAGRVQCACVPRK